MNVEGVVPVLVSPMNEDGSPDIEGYHRLLDFIYQYPVGGLWILGSASEDFLISFDDRVQITKTVSEHVGGRAPIIVSCGHMEFSEMERFFDATCDMNIDAYHHLSMGRRMNTKLTIRYFTKVADRSPKPLWLYSNGYRGQQIPVDAVAELSRHPNIVGIKAAGFDLLDIVPFCMMSRDDFVTIGSGGSHMLTFMAMGARAHTISPACCFPREYNEAWDLWHEGNIEEARQLLFKISRINKALPHPANTETCAEAKGVLEVLGVCKRYVKWPFWSYTDEEIEQTRRVLEKANMLPVPAAVK